MSFLRITENIVIFLGVPGFISWLNRLGSLQQDFDAHFSHIKVNWAVDISKSRKFWLVGYFFIPSALWLAAQLFMLLPALTFNAELWALGYAWVFTGIFSMFGQMLLEDVKVFLMLQCLGKVYKGFREAIAQEVAIRHGGITAKNCEFWLEYRTKLRRLVEQTGENLKSQIMLSLTETLVATSVGLFLNLILRSSQPEVFHEGFGYAAIGVFYSLIHALRLYVKVFLAENIYNEVRMFLVLFLTVVEKA